LGTGQHLRRNQGEGNEQVEPGRMRTLWNLLPASASNDRAGQCPLAEEGPGDNPGSLFELRRDDPAPLFELRRDEAGEGIRTLDVQLGKLRTGECNLHHDKRLLIGYSAVTRCFQTAA